MNALRYGGFASEWTEDSSKTLNCGRADGGFAFESSMRHGDGVFHHVTIFKMFSTPPRPRIYSNDDEDSNNSSIPMFSPPDVRGAYLGRQREESSSPRVMRSAQFFRDLQSRFMEDIHNIDDEENDVFYGYQNISNGMRNMQLN